MPEFGIQMFLGSTPLTDNSVYVGTEKSLVNPVFSLYAPFELGQQREGGTVFFVTGSFPNQSVLIAATEEATPATLSWGCSGTSITTFDTIFSGSTNTTNIVNNCASASIGARYCDDLVLNGYSDWYLPSKDELNQLYINRTLVSGISSASLSFYMSSTQGTNATNYNAQDFSNGNQTNIRDKAATENNRVRAIRKIVQ